MWSSPLLLSLTSVFGLLGLALITLALATDSWTDYQVNRREIINAMNRNTELNARLKDNVVRNPLYFSRSYGLFLVCFTDAVPSDIGSFSKFGSPCIWNDDYYPLDAAYEKYDSLQIYRYYAMWGAAILYLLGLVVFIICSIFGMVGCWRRSTKIVLTTALLMLFSVMFLAGSMACWHLVNYLERHVLDIPPFYKSWEPILKQGTRFSYGWSYVVSWVGIAFILLASTFMLLSYKKIKEEEERAFEAKHGAYMMPNYYDKSSAMMPYGYGTYGGYPTAYPAAYYGQYPVGTGYYGYMTYGR
ncbi:unnamed protein product [Onchocerca ochengi]|uniref:MARVEL domain-containing protein n=2 Tax=Onchocerca TaxID=6281 RepID=A0A182E0U6_ONCOC|nr:unnamed protein product [Onchocerca ochengi]